MTPETKHELHWQAFRYVAGEMGEEERDGFEQQLASDQPAREAVVDAVELTRAVKCALQNEPVMPGESAARHSFTSWWLGAAMGSAACLLIVLGIQPSPVPNREAANPSSPSKTSSNDEGQVLQDDGALAARWSELRQREDSPWNELTASELTAGDDELGDSLSGWDVDSPIEEDGQTAPDWMMAAVSAAKKIQGMGEEMDMERAVDGPLEQ